jgi:hypothetical protein
LPTIAGATGSVIVTRRLRAFKSLQNERWPVHSTISAPLPLLRALISPFGADAGSKA